MSTNAFSDTASDDSPLLNIDDKDTTESIQHFTNDDPLDPNGFRPYTTTGVTDILQSHWQDPVASYPTLQRSRHASECSSLSLPRSRHASECSSSSLQPRSRHFSEGSNSSLPRSRHTSSSESSNSPLSSLSCSQPISESLNSLLSFADEFTNCHKHAYANDFYCCDCSVEICRECATGGHKGHNFRPANTCRQKVLQYRVRRNGLQEYKMKTERAMRNLNYKKQAVTEAIKTYFGKVRDVLQSREQELCESVSEKFERRKLVVNARSYEAEKALQDGDQILNMLFDGCKNRNTEKSSQAGRLLTKHLDSMKDVLQCVAIPDDVIAFTPPHDNALISELETLGSVTCFSTTPYSLQTSSNSYGSSWNSNTYTHNSCNSNCGSWNGSSGSNSLSKFGSLSDLSNGHSFNGDFRGSNGYVAMSPNYNQPSNRQPFFDFGPNSYTSNTSPVPSESQCEKLALQLANFQVTSPPALPQSPSALSSSSEQFPSGRSILPFGNSKVLNAQVPSALNGSGGVNLKASANINIPSAMNAVQFNRSILRMDPHVDRALQWNRCTPNNELKVSFHRSRNYARIRKPVVVFGQEGKEDADLCRPWGVCCDDKGHVIVADRSNNRIQIFRSDGTHVRHFGEAGSEEGQFNRPAGVAIDLRGRIVVCDKDNHRIQVFTMEGILCLCFGRRGSTIGQFNYPWDVAVAPVQGLYAISDTRNHRIQMFSDKGEYVKQFGFESHSPTWKLFDSPRGLCFTPESTLMCTDFNSHRLFEIDYMMGARMVRLEHYKKCQLYRPQKLTMDNEGNILVTDCRNNRVVVFARDGRPIASFGVAGKEPGQFDRPSGMSMTADGKIVIVDFGNNRIQIF